MKNKISKSNIMFAHIYSELVTKKKNTHKVYLQVILIIFSNTFDFENFPKINCKHLSAS